MKLKDHMGTEGRVKENKKNEVEGEGRENIGRKQDKGERKTDFSDYSSCLWKGRGDRGTEEVVGVNSHCQMNCSTQPLSLSTWEHSKVACVKALFKTMAWRLLSPIKSPYAVKLGNPDHSFQPWEGLTTHVSSQGPAGTEDSVSYHDRHCQLHYFVALHFLRAVGL